jgi:hypothetical protein
MPPRPLAQSSVSPLAHAEPPSSSRQLAQTRSYDSAARCVAENRMRAVLADYLRATEAPGRVVRAVESGHELDLAVRTRSGDAAVGFRLGSHSHCHSSRTLLIDASGESFLALDGTRVRLHERPVLQRLFTLLLNCRCSEEPRSMSASELIAGVWQDERIDRRTGKNRLHVAVAILRKLGLHGILVRRHDGYRLDPNVPIRVDACAVP